MAPTEYEEYLDNAPTIRHFVPDDNLEVDTFLYNNGVRPGDIDNQRKSAHAYIQEYTGAYDTSYYPRKYGPSPRTKADQGVLYHHKGDNNTHPKIGQMIHCAPKDPPVSIVVNASSLPSSPTALHPSARATDAEVVRSYKTPERKKEECERKLGRIEISLDKEKRHSRHPRSYFDERKRKLREPIGAEIADLNKKIKKGRKKANKQVEKRGGRPDYGHLRAEDYHER
ncbi:hypothetical protein DE146DRAFT_760873 [Phaeosphaeria sp. MPI-PUGE-AT-0046c]|nr:hypothetical protein DE146DRAFT_760873 [Phaeosphaeria sp. MPI-PUGE-AT-0046c]